MFQRANYRFSAQKLKGGLKMGEDKKFVQQSLLKNLPVVEKDVHEHYRKNKEYIGQTLEWVVDRKMNKVEKSNLKEYAMNLALQQVASMYEDKLGVELPKTKVETKREKNE